MGAPGAAGRFTIGALGLAALADLGAVGFDSIFFGSEGLPGFVGDILHTPWNERTDNGLGKEGEILTRSRLGARVNASCVHRIQILARSASANSSRRSNAFILTFSCFNRGCLAMRKMLSRLTQANQILF